MRNQFTNVPDSEASYDTMSFSLQHRFRGLFVQGGVDRHWRDEIRSPACPSTSPLNTDPIRVYSYGSTVP